MRPDAASGAGAVAGLRAPRARLLVVDDEANQRDMLEGILRRAGFDVVLAPGAGEAIARVESDAFDLVLTDQRMPRTDGLALLDRCLELRPRMPVVLMTAYGSVADAVSAMKRGAADYLAKPFDRDELILVLERVLRQRRLEAEVAELHGALRDRDRLCGILGSSAAMQEVFSLVERIAATDVPVLIEGESGTGKELVARAIHGKSTRAAGPFVALNCAAVPESLLESEFFGHERGAFTGAVRAHPGRFEQAQHGTLFLDEIGAMRVDLQAKLLRALQEHEVQRIGATSPTSVDVRILAATCEELEQAIARKTFREDLYYRLAVVPVKLPPLRERPDDVPLLVDHFARAAAAKLGREVPRVGPDVVERLQLHHWPGNVRELENVVERMVILARSDALALDDLPRAIREGGGAAGAGGLDLPPGGVKLGELERHFIQQALRRCRGNIGRAARMLGLSYKTMQYRIRKHGLEREAPGASTDGGAEDGAGDEDEA